MGKCSLQQLLLVILFHQGPGLSIASALVYVTTSSTHKVSQKTRDAGQPEARAHDFLFAWHHLTLVGKFSSLRHRASHCSRKEKRKTRPTLLQLPQEEGILCPAFAHWLKQMEEERQNSRWDSVLHSNGSANGRKTTLWVRRLRWF